MEPLEQKHLATLEQANEFVQNPHVVGEYQQLLWACSDDRYRDGELRQSRFGGHLGYVMGLLALKKRFNWNVSASQLVDMVAKTAKNDGTKFTGHTDENAEHPKDPQKTVESFVLGCGHAAKAAVNPEEYGLDGEDIKEAIAYFKEKVKSDPENFHMDELTGDHDAIGVLFNTGLERTFEHTHSEKSFYVIDTKKDELYVTEKLIPALTEELQEFAQANISADEFNTLLWDQTLTTAAKLAPNFPIFESNADEENRTATLIDHVPTPKAA
jgi:hypothetical protein